MSGTHVLIRGNEAWLLNAQIPPYQPKNISEAYDPKRGRRLLLRREEIKNLSGKLTDKRFHLIPLSAYLKKGLIKLELGLGRSRKKEDKRELLKSKAAEREIRRAGS